MQTVYVDLLFMINFSMDFLCVFLVSKLLFKKISLLRAIIGAAIGGTFSVCMIFMPAESILNLILDVLCYIFICLVVFAKKGDGIKTLLINCSTYFISSVLLGGIMTATFSLLNNSGITLDDTEGNDFPPWLVLGIGLFSFAVSYFGGRYIKRRSCKEIVDIKMVIADKELTVSAMCDSGNFLCDSISGKPVIVADMKHAKYFFDGIDKLNIDVLDKLEPKVACKAVLIPYSTASGSRTMVAFRPRELTINHNGKVKSADALIGFADIKCTTDGCSALIPSELL